MSFVDNELEAGEEIIFKINRGRKFNHYYKTISQACITFPLIAYFIWKYFSTLFVDFPQPTSVDPILVQMLDAHLFVRFYIWSGTRACRCCHFGFDPFFC